jgi:hypothetical protein
VGTNKKGVHFFYLWVKQINVIRESCTLILNDLSRFFIFEIFKKIKRKTDFKHIKSETLSLTNI